MAEIKEGWRTSEFKLGGIIAIVTTFGEQLGIFDTSAFADDPVLMLIYRSVQLIVIGVTAVYYMNSRSGIKKNGQIPAPVILENREG